RPRLSVPRYTRGRGQRHRGSKALEGPGRRGSGRKDQARVRAIADSDPPLNRSFTSLLMVSVTSVAESSGHAYRFRPSTSPAADYARTCDIYRGVKILSIMFRNSHT